MRLYHYYFEGMERKITVMAENRDEAWMIMMEKRKSLPEYRDKRVDQETTSMPLKGKTEAEIEGKLMVWMGDEEGWIEKMEK